MKLLGAGGGTLGHAFPLKQIIKEIKKRKPEAELIIAGVKDFEKEIAAELGAEFFQLNLKGLPRKLSLDLIRVPAFGLKDAFRLRKMMKNKKIDAVICTGGYTAFPAALAAVLLRKPLFLHEQNAVFGLVNRLFSSFAETVFLSLPPVSGMKKNFIISGNPVREEARAALSKSEAKKIFGFEPERPVLLAFGGSLGAQSINNAVLKLLHELNKQDGADFQVLHFTGRRNYDLFLDELEKSGIDYKNSGWYRVFPEYRKMGEAYAASDLVLSRSGASTVAELEVNGVPAVLVPYPFAAENHQFYNALYLKDKGMACLVEDEKLSRMSGSELIELVTNCLLDKEMNAAARKAAEKVSGRKPESIIAETIIKLLELKA